MLSQRHYILLVVIGASVASMRNASAQLDRVYPFEGNAISGAIAEIQRDLIVVQVGGAQRKLPINQIKRVVFDREPGPLGDGRSLVIDEQYSAALAQLNQLKVGGIQRAEIKADAMFYIAFCEAKVALDGQGSKPNAVKKLLDFEKAYPQSWHYYDAVRAIGDLALALGRNDIATTYYGKLGQARNAEYQLRARYLVGWAALKDKDFDKAGQAFDAVAGAKVNSPEQLRLQKLALAGKAAVLSGQSKPDEGLSILTRLIEESDPSDSELFGRLYNAQGACFAAKSDAEGAVISYLKTHLLFQSNTDAHAEALAELVELWPQIGEPERGTEARAILNKLYPGR